jgi:sigma-B regulation protein RsbU (phosphoserine phosphatase)
MAKLGSDLKTLAFTEKDPAAALKKLNDLLAERSRRGMFATVLYLELDSESGRMTLSNAGHLPPIVKRSDGTVKRFSPAGGSPLGILPGMEFGQETLLLGPGDTVVLYTDGIIEAMNARDELYGYERFEELIRKSPSDPDALKSAIIGDVNRFTGLSPQHDDMTLVCFGALK